MTPGPQLENTLQRQSEVSKAGGGGGCPSMVTWTWKRSGSGRRVILSQIISTGGHGQGDKERAGEIYLQKNEDRAAISLLTGNTRLWKTPEHTF